MCTCLQVSFAKVKVQKSLEQTSCSARTLLVFAATSWASVLQIALVCAAQKKTPNHRVKQFTTNGQQLTVPNRQMYVYIYKCKFHKNGVPPKHSFIDGFYMR